MAAAAAARTKGVRKSLISRTLERCRSGLGGGGGGRGAAAPVAGCFSVYVGAERERFVVRTEYANHPLFRRLLDDAEREYGYAAQGPLALPSCAVDAFLDVLWQMEHDRHDDDLSIDGGDEAAAAASPICGLRTCGSKGRAAGYRMLSPARMSRPSPMAATPTRIKR
ncbi:uncharacterized protein LOC102714609 [Oryza brachyantha]|uniref:uncharacterized protein LOC102714609 n=1 Tax=Oryza brachyantha TaxID=4533 RepID=UPI001ADCA475|nr:uncharacterized protein LOC102714609 [Oryza brachyantha]